jgi:pimeloyl-ACP methyl ester carboxylesterase
VAATIWAGVFFVPACGAPALTIERSATLAQLYSAAETAALAETLPADRVLRYRVRDPEAGARGVLVYVSPTDSGELAADWAAVLDRKKLLYIAADGFGNSRPTAERVLVAMAALRMARQLGAVDGQRLYVAGMSGGGRVASQIITHFPQSFSGAFCIVGADYFMPRDESLRSLVAARRLVFLTGSRDFNQRELRLVFKRYRQAGVANVLLIDQPDFGHAIASAQQLGNALDFLDAR